MTPSSSTGRSSTTPPYRLRRYEANDVDGILAVFRANLVEEWTKYHGGKYLPNAEKYIERCCCSDDSDLRNIELVYFDGGGYFWVLADADNVVCGTLGLEILESETATGELRRMCLIPSLRRQGWGTRMFRALREEAETMGLCKIVCSTPEHDNDVLDFYKSLDFVDTGRRGLIHNSPIQEVFLERNMASKE